MNKGVGHGGATEGGDAEAAGKENENEIEIEIEKKEQEEAEEVTTLPPRFYDACKVFVLFNSEQSQRACLEAMCVGKMHTMLDSHEVIDKRYLLEGNLLHVEEAPEPSSVQYEFLDTDYGQHCAEQARSWAIMAFILFLTYSTVVACFNGGSPILGVSKRKNRREKEMYSKI